MTKWGFQSVAISSVIVVLQRKLKTAKIWSLKNVSYNRGCHIIECRIKDVRLKEVSALV